MHKMLIWYMLPISLPQSYTCVPVQFLGLGHFGFKKKCITYDKLFFIICKTAPHRCIYTKLL